jgi:hypothetical protein
VQVKIVIPFEVKTVSVTSDIPIAEQLVRGDVPIYWGGNGSSPSIVLPGKDSAGSSKSTTSQKSTTSKK